MRLFDASDRMPYLNADPALTVSQLRKNLALHRGRHGDMSSLPADAPFDTPEVEGPLDLVLRFGDSDELSPGNRSRRPAHPIGAPGDQRLLGRCARRRSRRPSAEVTSPLCDPLDNGVRQVVIRRDSHLRRVGDRMNTDPAEKRHRCDPHQMVVHAVKSFNQQP